MEVGRTGPVVVGVDGSVNSARAMLVAGRHARAIGACVTVVHAVGLTDEIDGVHVPAAGHRDEIAAAFDRWCAPLRHEYGDDFEMRLVDGSPVDVLLRTAHDLDATMIVVGRRGAGGGRPELQLGSTAHQILEHARCPVLVIPPVGRSTAVGHTLG